MKRRETLLTKHTRTAVLNGNPKIHWNADGTAFQYERQERSGSEVTSVLAEVNGMDGTRKMIQKAEKAGAGRQMPALLPAALRKER